MRLAVKICGLRTPAAIAAAAAGGARYAGFVFFPRSPRAVTAAEAAELVRAVPAGLERVGLFVDPDDTTLESVLRLVPLDWIQLHGTETPMRAQAIRAGWGLPVIKAIPVAGPGDLDTVPAWEASADALLFDAKPPPGSDRPGGHGRPFDWPILAGRQWERPWMLSGGLNAANLREAVQQTGATTVDVSSGVERRPGDKDPALIRTFLTTAEAL